MSIISLLVNSSKRSALYATLFLDNHYVSKSPFHKLDRVQAIYRKACQVQKVEHFTTKHGELKLFMKYIDYIH